MRILLSTLSMSYLSGAPMYNYELCRELKRQGHRITMISDWHGPLRGNQGYKLKENLEKDNVICVDFDFNLQPNDYDLIIASEKLSEDVLDRIPNTPAINIVHSEYDCEEPISNREQILHYVCIRRSILDHVVKEHNIPIEKCVIIPNGIDRERFRPIEKSKRDYYKVVAPCTLDKMREPFINKLIDSANEKRQVYFYGFDCGAELHKNEYAFIDKDYFDIENVIADADEVAGILLGRVNLEAWSCGVNSSIYDPITLESKIYPPPIDFDETYNIKNVVKRIIGLIETFEDLTVVIPHYDQTAKLKDILDDIRGIKRCIVPKGGTFAENCNIGFNVVKTPYVCFLNDDARIPNLNLLRSMMKMVKDRYDIVGCRTSDGFDGCYFDDGIWKNARKENKEPKYPAGVCLIIKSEVYKTLFGFSEEFKNGCEDLDFMLRAERQGYVVGISNSVITHEHEGSSTGRYDHAIYNTQLFNKKWNGKYYLPEHD